MLHMKFNIYNLVILVYLLSFNALSNCHHCFIPDYFHHTKKKPHTYSFLLLGPGNH